MPIKATDLKRGQALIFNGQLNTVIGTEHVKPGKGPAYVQAKMKNVETGTIKINRFNSSDKLEDVSIDKRVMQYLYDSRDKATVLSSSWTGRPMTRWKSIRTPFPWSRVSGSRKTSM